MPESVLDDHVDYGVAGPIIAEDYALKQHLSGIKLQDARSTERSVPVRFAHPSEEIEASQLPVILIEHHSVVPDMQRNHVGKIEVAHWPSTTPLDEEGTHTTEWPLPVRLFYHVIAEAVSHQHHAALMRALLRPDMLPLHNGWLWIPATETFTVMHVLGYQRDRIVRQDRSVYRVTVPVYVEASLLKTQIAAVEAIQTIDLTVDERTSS